MTVMFLKLVAFTIFFSTFVLAQLPQEELDAISDMKNSIPSLNTYWSNADICNVNSLTMTCSGGHVVE